MHPSSGYKSFLQKLNGGEDQRISAEKMGEEDSTPFEEAPRLRPRRDLVSSWFVGFGSFSTIVVVMASLMILTVNSSSEKALCQHRRTHR